MDGSELYIAPPGSSGSARPRLVAQPPGKVGRPGPPGPGLSRFRPFKELNPYGVPNGENGQLAVVPTPDGAAFAGQVLQAANDVRRPDLVAY